MQGRGRWGHVPSWLVIAFAKIDVQGYAAVRIFAFTAIVAALLVACDQGEHPDEYLGETIPPCTPEPLVEVDPCEPNLPQPYWGLGHPDPELGDGPSGVRELFPRDEWNAYVPHVVLRGTYIPGTTRCNLADRKLHTYWLDTKPEVYQAYNEKPSLECYMDVRVNEYLLGTGPPTVTVAVIAIDPDWGLEKEVIELRVHLENAGRESIIFLAPSPNILVKTWWRTVYWDVQKGEDGTVFAAHPLQEYWQREPARYEANRGAIEVELAAFTQELKDAYQEAVPQPDGQTAPDAGFPKPVMDILKLGDYFDEVGDDTPPALPPPPYARVVGEHYDHQLLVFDCGIWHTWFHGLLWAAEPPLHDGEGGPPPGWPSPTPEEGFEVLAGVMELEREDRAVFTADSELTAEFRLAKSVDQEFFFCPG